MHHRRQDRIAHISANNLPSLITFFTISIIPIHSGLGTALHREVTGLTHIESILSSANAEALKEYELYFEIENIGNRDALQMRMDRGCAVTRYRSGKGFRKVVKWKGAPGPPSLRGRWLQGGSRSPLQLATATRRRSQPKSAPWATARRALRRLTCLGDTALVV